MLQEVTDLEVAVAGAMPITGQDMALFNLGAATTDLVDVDEPFVAEKG